MQGQVKSLCGLAWVACQAQGGRWQAMNSHTARHANQRTLLYTLLQASPKPTFLAVAAPAFLPGAPPARLAVTRGVAAALPPSFSPAAFALLAARVAAAWRFDRSLRSAASHSPR